jgi:hypothetical protein
METLLIIEQFFSLKFYLIEANSVREFGHALDMLKSHC